MRRILQTKQFAKDLKRMRKRGKNIEKLKTVIHQLANHQTLLPKYRDHALTGNWQPCRDCHIEPDWLLIYVVDEQHVSLERTGTHSDLF